MKCSPVSKTQYENNFWLVVAGFVRGEHFSGGTSNFWRILFTNQRSFVAQWVFRRFQMQILFLNLSDVFTFFQNLIVDFISGFTIVENRARHCNVQALWPWSEVVDTRLWSRSTATFGDFILVYGIVTLSRPDMHFLAEIFDYLMDRVVMMAFRCELLLWVVWRGWSWSASPTVNTVLWNAWIEVADETWVVETISRRATSVFFVAFVNRILLVAEQRVSLSFRCNGKFIMAVILICTRVCEILMVGFVLVNIIEIVRKITVVNRRRMTV